MSNDYYVRSKLSMSVGNEDVWTVKPPKVENFPYSENENHYHDGGGTVCLYELYNAPIVAGTITGFIYNSDGLHIQNFMFTGLGKIGLNSFGEVQNVRVLNGTINNDTGTITLDWSIDPGYHKIVVSYEYEAAPTGNWGYMNASTISDTSSNLEYTTTLNPYYTCTLSNSPVPPLPSFPPQDVSKQSVDASSSYIDYLVDQLAITKDNLKKAEDKLKVVEIELFNEYEKKIEQMKQFMVTKLDEFLKLKTSEQLKGKTTVEIFEEVFK